VAGFWVFEGGEVFGIIGGWGDVGGCWGGGGGRGGGVGGCFGTEIDGSGEEGRWVLLLVGLRTISATGSRSHDS